MLYVAIWYVSIRPVVMLYVAIWYVSIRPVVLRVKEELQFFLHPHNNRTYQIATYSIKTLLKMDY